MMIEPQTMSHVLLLLLLQINTQTSLLFKRIEHVCQCIADGCAETQLNQSILHVRRQIIWTSERQYFILTVIHCDGFTAVFHGEWLTSIGTIPINIQVHQT